MMSAVSRALWAVLFLVQVLLQSSALAAPPIPNVCRVIIEKILKGEDFQLDGFYEGQVGSMPRAIVLRMTEAEFASSVGHFKSEFTVLRSRDFLPNNQQMVSKQLRRPVHLGRNAFFRMNELHNGVEFYGTRYRVIQQSSGDQRILRFDVTESLTRAENGNVAHYASVNVHEITPGGAATKLGWADFPHMHGRTPRWFHAHDARTGDVIGNIPTPGFVKSILPETINWISAAVRDGRL